MRTTGVTSNGEFWICRALSIIEALQKDSKHITTVAEIDTEDLALHTQVRTLDTQLQQVRASYKLLRLFIDLVRKASPRRNSE